MATQNPEPEEIEGIESTPLDDLGEYPIDSVLIRQEQRSVFEIKRRMDPELKSGRFILCLLYTSYLDRNRALDSPALAAGKHVVARDGGQRPWARVVFGAHAGGSVSFRHPARLAGLEHFAPAGHLLG